MPLEIPLSNEPSSTTETPLGGRTLTLTTRFNVRGGGGLSPYWTLDITEGQEPLALGLPLVLGVNIIRQLNLGIGAFIMVDRTGTSSEATRDTLGDTVILLYFTPEEVEALNDETI